MKTSIPLKRKYIEGNIHKRVPQRSAAAVTDIYVSQKSKLPVVVKRIRHLMMNEKHHAITVHGLGAMISRAIRIAQATQSALENQVDLRLFTNTVTLIDDIIPENMDQDIQPQQRLNSAIRIELVAKPSLLELQNKTSIITSHPSRNRKLRR